MQEFVSKFKYVILIVIVFIIGIFIFLKRDRIVIIDGVNGIFTYNGKWNYNNKFSKYDSKKYYIYSGNEYLGNYKMKYGSGWVVYNSDGIIPYDYDLIATNSDKVKVVSYDEVELDYDSAVNQFLRSRNIYSNNYYYNIYEYDIDGDSLSEQLVLVSNFSMQNTEDKFYSFVLFYNDERFVPIKYSITSNISDIELYSLSSIFDNNNHIQFIINTNYFSKPDKMCQELFEYNNGIKKLYKCK